MRRRVAAVIHRWGQKVVGGAETLAREVLVHLSGRLDITVLTSCACDYVSWANSYPAGTSEDGKLTVIRFPVRMQRPPRSFRFLSRIALHPQFRRISPPMWIENLWIRLQGPYCPALIEYLNRHQGDYDAFLFYTYLYYPTVIGLPLVADRSILVPTAHDEPAIYLRTYRKTFGLARGLIYLTPEEQTFANQLFGLWKKPQQVASMHIPTLDEPTECTPCLPVRDFLAASAIKQPYLLYLGRLDPGKGVDKMFDFFTRYVEEAKRDVLLILAGDGQARVPDSASIRNLGFLNDREKRAAILGSRALVLLSPHESFSISVLEAMGLGRPVIVAAESHVLKGHVERSGSGFAVSNYDEFRTAANAVFAGGEELGLPGMRYVRENYTWDRVESAYLGMIDGLPRG